MCSSTTCTFNSLAAFPHESQGDLAVYVWRVSRGGALTLESLAGADFQTNQARPKVTHALVHEGHMHLLVPPPEYTHRQWLQQVATHHAPPLETPCFGWGSILLQSASSVPTTPGDVLAKCQRCKTNSATLTGDSHVGHLAEDPNSVAHLKHVGTQSLGRSASQTILCPTRPSRPVRT